MKRQYISPSANSVLLSVVLALMAGSDENGKGLTDHNTGDIPGSGGLCSPTRLYR